MVASDHARDSIAPGLARRLLVGGSLRTRLSFEGMKYT